MGNSKVTLAELRKEAMRVGLDTNRFIEASVLGEPCLIADWVSVDGKSRMGARRRMLRLLRALLDGALKEG